MRRTIAIAFLAGCLSAGAGVAGAAAIRHVVHISVDGLRGDLLRNLMDEPPGGLAGFARLRQEGAMTFNARCDFASSLTIPNHTSMLTGRPSVVADPIPQSVQHGYTDNTPAGTDILHLQGIPPEYKASAFDMVHDRGGRTAMVASKSRFAFFVRSFDAAHGRPDTVDDDNGTAKIDLPVVAHNRSDVAMAALLAEATGGNFPAYTFLHLYDPDFAGHTMGWGSPGWVFAVHRVDSFLALLLATIDRTPDLRGSTAIVLTADHGGGSPSHTHVDPLPLVNITIPLAMWGPGIPAGVDAYSLFANRFDPADGRIPNSAAAQPLRNGDTGNIVMKLLGLPPIDGSFFRPEFRAVPEIRLTGPGIPAGSVAVVVPGYLDGWTLEAADNPAGTWTSLTTTPDSAGLLRHTEPRSPSSRWFRLRFAP